MSASDDYKLILEHCHPLMAVLTSFLLICILNSSGTFHKIISNELKAQYKKSIEILKRGLRKTTSNKAYRKHPCIERLEKIFKKRENRVFTDLAEIAAFISEYKSYDASQIQKVYDNETKHLDRNADKLSMDVFPTLSCFVMLLYAVIVFCFDMLAKHHRNAELFVETTLFLTIFLFLFLTWRWVRMFTRYCGDSLSWRWLRSLYVKLEVRNRRHWFDPYNSALTYGTFSWRLLIMTVLSFIIGLILSHCSSLPYIDWEEHLRSINLSITLFIGLYGLVLPFTFPSILYEFISHEAEKLKDVHNSQYKSRIDDFHVKANSLVKRLDPDWYEDNKSKVLVRGMSSSLDKNKISLTVRSIRYMGVLHKRIIRRIKRRAKA